MISLYMEPEFGGVDEGDGGIRRVVEALRAHLPTHGVSIATDREVADVVAAHIAPLAPTARWLEHRPEVPYVLHLHGAYWAEYEWPKWALEGNALLMEGIRQADAITVPSEWVAQAVRRNSLRDVTVIGHGIEVDEWPWTEPEMGEDGRPYVLWNKTRTDAVCDPQELVELVKLAPDVTFVTTYWPTVLAPPNVRVVGRQPFAEARETVKRAGVYLCTSRETFGIGTIEAMCAGAPVLGYAWGGQAEFIRQGETGWLATPGDREGLLAGLRECLARRKEMAQAAREYVLERFRWDLVIPQYAELYERTLAAKRKRCPKVSVIVPAYELDRYLPDALDSVAAQTLQDWECVIVDDNSPDRTAEVAQSYMARDERFRLVRNKENLYLAGSLNAGVRESRGQYIVALDADNWIEPTTLEVLAAEMDKDRRIDIAYRSVRFVLDDGKTPDESVGPGGKSGWPMAFRPDWQLIRRNMVPSTALYRRRVWDCTGGYRRRYRTAEDADFWTRATSYGFRARMVTEMDTLVYRQREGSMSRVENPVDWTAWYPWSKGGWSPAAYALEPQVPIPSCEPILVSVIVPVGPGHEHLLIDALDSVDAQTFRLWEAIVINDTGKPLPYVPAWARVIEAGPERVGVAAARNRGIEACRGRVFIPLDADDTLEPTATAAMYAVWERFKGYVYCDWMSMDGSELKPYSPPEYNAQHLIDNGALHAVTALYPVKAWRDVGGFDETLPAWEDWDFQLKLANAEVCGTRYPVPLFTYRMHTGMRREANLAQFEDSKAALMAKWEPFFERRLTLAGCRSCGGGGGGHVDAPQQQQQQFSNGTPPPEGGQVLVEFVGQRIGAAMYKGPSGRQYRFDATDEERVKMVLPQDAHFFAHLADFRVRDPDAAPA